MRVDSRLSQLFYWYVFSVFGSFSLQALMKCRTFENLLFDYEF